MASLPRVITVDPAGTIARIVRAAVDLMDRPVIISDVPTGTLALEEIQKAGCQMLITAWELSNDMRGLELALRAKQKSQETAVMILADVDDPDELDAETLAESPFVYMSRPVDVHQFMRVLMAGFDGQDLREAMTAPTSQPSVVLDMGPVPGLDLNAAQGIIDQLLADLGAMAIVLASRVGEVLLERGAVGYLDRDRMTQSLLPLIGTNIDVKEIIGGNASSLVFYDGENYDVFVLSVGLHHFLCVAFDGEGGSRQFGAVNRFGRRAAEDLIALLGANAWLIQRAAVQKEESRIPRKGSRKSVEAEEEIIPLATAEGLIPEEPKAEAISVIEQMEPIADLDLSIFDQLDKVDESAADDLFDLEKIEQIANQQRKGKAIGFDEAIDLGIMPS